MCKVSHPWLYDLIAIGSGPAGKSAAIQAAKSGKRVAIVERRPSVGGVSLHAGTIPSKTMRSAVLLLTGAHQKEFYGKKYSQTRKITLNHLRYRVSRVLEEETKVMENQLRRNGVDYYHGQAKFTDANTIELSLKGHKLKCVLTSDKFVIATGSLPRRPAEVPFDYKTIFDGNLFFSNKCKIKELPESMVILGAGVIGMEYACIFALLGCEVTVVNEREKIMGYVDKEILTLLKRYMSNVGVKFVLGHKILEIGKNNDKGFVKLAEHKTLRADVIHYALGREACTKSLGLEALGILLDSRGNICVDTTYRTNVSNIYAAGDVIGWPSLACTSSEQGRVAACHAFDLEWLDFRENFPFGIYTIPAISMVGKTEEQLNQEQISFQRGIAFYKEIAKAVMNGDESGALKILFDPKTLKILGIHCIGDQAAEIVHIGQAVMALGGGIDFFVNNVFNYPTYAEAYKVAALNGINAMKGKTSFHSLLE